MKPSVFHTVLGVIFGTSLLLNGWAIYRGTIFQADLRIPGFQLQHGALAFTPSLIGTYHFNPALDTINPSEKSFLYIFTSTIFPVPNLNDLVYQDAHILAKVDNPQYTSRCVRLNNLISFTMTSYPVYLYENTMMDITGSGVQGNICQLLFSDPASYASFDSVCYNGSTTGIACMRENYLIACLTIQDLKKYTVANCGSINTVKNNIHYSGAADGEKTNWLLLDPDINQALDWNTTNVPGQP